MYSICDVQRNYAEHYFYIAYILYIQIDKTTKIYSQRYNFSICLHKKNEYMSM